MSEEKGVGVRSSSSQDKAEEISVEGRQQPSTEASQSRLQQSPPRHGDEKRKSDVKVGHSSGARDDERKPVAERDEPFESATAALATTEGARQVIAVSASKGPAAFFNLARKFLVTDEMCDLSALEGAIVSAVDAAHLLERSQLATIVRSVKKSKPTIL
jgi:hypothetical protein